MDIKDFFAHENSSSPPSISDLGKLRKPSKKSDIVSCIIKSAGESATNTRYPKVTSLIIDGAALVHMLIPKSNLTFQQYFDQIIQPYIMMRLKTVDRVDLVFDQYMEESIKNETRQLRGSGPRVNVKSNVVMPKSFNCFLANSKNKEGLFGFIAENLSKIDLPAGKQIISTFKDKVISFNRNTFEPISPVTHEEADARLFLHVWHASEYSDHSKISVKTVDSDVVVIALYVFPKLPKLEELWVEYGSGKHVQYLPIHELHRKLPKGVTDILPFFTPLQELILCPVLQGLERQLHGKHG